MDRIYSPERSLDVVCELVSVGDYTVGIYTNPRFFTPGDPIEAITQDPVTGRVTVRCARGTTETEPFPRCDVFASGSFRLWQGPAAQPMQCILEAAPPDQSRRYGDDPAKPLWRPAHAAALDKMGFIDLRARSVAHAS